MKAKYSKKKKSEYIIRSVDTNKLTNEEIKQICKLKNKQWKFNIKSQLKWFKNNIKKFDFHNLFYIQSRLIGYTLIRKRTCKIENSKKLINYLLFDTLVIEKKYQGLQLSNLLMNFNNVIINQSGMFSFLICSNKLVNFYKKNGWKKLKKNMFDVVDHPFLSNGMIFNRKNENKKYFFYVNR